MRKGEKRREGRRETRRKIDGKETKREEIESTKENQVANLRLVKIHSASHLG